MSKIKMLSPQTIARIAAGEIVVRPSAVIKELIENSLDAGASKIQVLIKKAGRDLIRIVDNGVGMSQEDAVLSLQRHTTSKLTDDSELFSLNTYGFRGEALASISSVSMFSMMTCQKGMDFGVRVISNGGEEVKVAPCVPVEGTQIDIQNLFFNVPARRKFLKNDQTELSHIMNIFINQSLTALNVHFELKSENKKSLFLPPVSSLSERIDSIYGDSFGKNLFCIENKMGGMEISGSTSTSLLTKSNRSVQKFFVNGRHVTDKTISMAVHQVYRDVLVPGRYPVCFLFLSVPSDQIDVNVHPSKEIIKFQNESVVRQLVYRSLKDTLNKMAHSESVGSLPDNKVHFASNIFDRKNKQFSSVEKKAIFSENLPKKTDPSLEKMNDRELISEKDKKDKFHSMRNSSFYSFYDNGRDKISEKKEISSFKEKGIDDSTSIDEGSLKTAISSETISMEDTGAIAKDIHKITKDSVSKEISIQKIHVEERESNRQDANKMDKEAVPTERGTQTPLFPGDDAQTSHCDAFFNQEKPFYKFKDLFIITEDTDNLIFIDQHAAQERVLYEKFLNYAQEEIVSQELLVPLSFDVLVSDVPLVESLTSFFTRIGFSIERFGDITFMIRSIPVFIRESSVISIVQNIMDDIRILGYPADDMANYFKEFIATMACRAAVKAGDKLEDEELTEIFRELEKCNDSNTCPHGRPTMIKISFNELKKKFRRIK